MHEMLLPREFIGGRLRRLHAGDQAAFQSIAHSGYRPLSGWSPMSDAEAQAFLDKMHCAFLFTPGQWVQLGIAKPESDELVGDIGLYLSEDGTSGEVGFTLKPHSQGHGVAARAVAALQLFFGLPTPLVFWVLPTSEICPASSYLNVLAFSSLSAAKSFSEVSRAKNGYMSCREMMAINNVLLIQEVFYAANCIQTFQRNGASVGMMLMFNGYALGCSDYPAYVSRKRNSIEQSY